MFNKEEIISWEINIEQKRIKDLYPEQKKYKCPRKEKLKDYRHPDRYFCWGKESSCVKKMCRRQYRSQCKHLMKREQYDALVKPIGTQGWLTW